MAAIHWTNLRGLQFTASEAGEASDFGEVLRNMCLKTKDAYEMFGGSDLSIGKRLFFAEMLDLDDAMSLLITDLDDRICAVVKKRMTEKEGENVLIHTR